MGRGRCGGLERVREIDPPMPPSQTPEIITERKMHIVYNGRGFCLSLFLFFFSFGKITHFNLIKCMESYFLFEKMIHRV